MIKKIFKSIWGVLKPVLKRMAQLFLLGSSVYEATSIIKQISKEDEAKEKEVLSEEMKDKQEETNESE